MGSLFYSLFGIRFGVPVGKGGSTMQLIRSFFSEDEAATAVEYAVMLALILVAVVGAIGTVGQESGGMWGGIQTDLNTAGFGG